MKKSIALFLAVVMLASVGMNVIAVSGEQIHGTENILPSETQIMQYALDFMRDSQGNNDLAIADFIPLYGLEEELTGYYVTFENGVNPAGYLLISLLTSGCPVVELSFEGTGPVEVTPMESMNLSTVHSSNHIIYTGPDQLFIPTNDDQFYSVYGQETITATQMETLHTATAGMTEAYETNDVNIYNGILDWKAANIRADSVFKISNFGAGTDYWLMTDFSNGGVCYPTAGTNILWYWGMKRGCTRITSRYEVATAPTNLAKARAIFQYLENGMGTLSFGTLDSQVIPGFESFFGVPAENGGVWNYATISNGSNYSTYQTALNGQCPIFLILKGGTGLFAEGHGVYTFGYASSSGGAKYLFVMDGWNTYGRFVKFDYYPRMFGWKIWVR